MPTVPDYGGRKVGETPLPGARQQGPGGVAETPGSLGAGVAGANAQLGETGLRLGLQVNEITEQHRLQEQKRREEIFELSATRQANDAAARILSDPQSGILNRRGLAVSEGRDKAFEDWNQTVSDIHKGATTPEQQLLAERITQTYTARLRDSINSHEIQEMDQYDEHEFNGLQASAASLIVSSATTSPGSVTDTIADVSDKAAKYADRRGLGPDAKAALVADVRNRLATAAVTETLTKGNPVLAKAYIDHYSEQGILTGDARTKLEEAVKRGLTDDAAETLATQIWTQHGPKTDDEAISLDRMEEAVRAQTKGDPDLMKATIAALHERKVATDDGRRERLDTVQQKLWGMVLQGAPYSAIGATAEGAAHPQELLKIRDYLDSKAAQEESRAYTREGRALQAYSREQQELEDKGWAKYFELANDPTALSKMTAGDIMAQLPTLGHAHVNRLLEAKEELGKSTAALSKATVDTDLFKDNAYRAGFNYVYNNPSQLSDTQKVALGKLRAAVEDGVAQEQLAQKRPLTRDEISAVQQKVMDNTVMVDRSFRTDYSVPSAMVTTDEAENAYVPIKQIPYDKVAAALNYLRSRNAAWARLSDTQLRAIPGIDRAIEQSYAARVLKRGVEQELGPLDEKVR